MQKVIETKKILKGIEGEKVFWVYASQYRFVMKITNLSGFTCHVTIESKNLADKRLNHTITNVVENACTGIEEVSKGRVLLLRDSWANLGVPKEGSKMSEAMSLLDRFLKFETIKVSDDAPYYTDDEMNDEPNDGMTEEESAYRQQLKKYSYVFSTELRKDRELEERKRNEEPES